MLLGFWSDSLITCTGRRSNRGTGRIFRPSIWQC